MIGLRTLSLAALLVACSGAPPADAHPQAAPPAAQPSTPAKPPAAKPEVAAPVEDHWLEELLRADPAFADLLADPARHRLQILVTIVEPGDPPQGREHGYRVDAEYTYPASAIKTFASVAALRELERLQAEGGSVELDTPIAFCKSGATRCRERSDLLQEIRKMQLVSDNRGFNRLYDFVGHRAINETAWALGFASVRIHHRMYDADDPQVRRTTARVELRPRTGPPLVIPQRTSDLELPPTTVTVGLAIGEARLVHGKRVPGPMDFSDKNAVTLRDLHRLALALARPELPGVPPLGLAPAHREALVAVMAELAPDEAPERYKPMWRGVARVLPPARIRYVSKAGRAFGFHLDNAYIEDRESGRAVAVTAVLYANADGVLDDDRYGYDTVTRPFFEQLGAALAKAVFAR